MSEVPEPIWQHMQQHLGYSDEEMARFRQDPRNSRVLAAGAELGTKTIVFEVVESHGCNSGHAVGTRFFYSADGNLLTKLAPSKVCAFILPNITQAIFAIQELVYAGVDPDSMCFKRTSCFDVGIQCGGWGKIVVEARVLDRAEAMALAGG